MEAAQHSPAGAGMVFLDELRGQTQFLELVGAEYLSEESALVLKYFRLYDRHPIKVFRFNYQSHDWPLLFAELN